MNARPIAYGDPARGVAELLLHAPQRRCREVPDHRLAPAAHRIVESIERLDAGRSLVERQRVVTPARARKRRLDGIYHAGRHPLILARSASPGCAARSARWLSLFGT